MRRFLPPLAGALLAASAAAQPVLPDTTLPEVSVVATRTGAVPAEAPARVAVLDAADVRAAGATSAAGLLDARAAALVRRYGPGGLATLALRGTGATHTLVLLDGHPLADPQLGQLDLALLPALLLERVEVLHGAGSALHGAGAMGGVVALTTPRAGEGSRLAVESRAGAWGERALAGTAALDAGRVAVLVAASGETAEGDFSFFDPNAGVAGGRVRRTGADRALGTLYARVETAGPARAALGVWAGAAERGVPGAAGTAEAQAGRQWDRHLRLWGDATLRPFSGATLRVGGLVQRAALRYAGGGSDDTGRTWLASADAELQAARPGWHLAAGAQGGLAAADHPALAEGAREGRLAGWAAATGRVGPLLVHPALRADGYLRQGAGALIALSPRLGLNLRAAPGLHLKASAGTAFRPPTFNDRFWRYADPALPAGDPALRPERGWTVDVGMHLAGRGLVAEVTAYAAGARDQIVWLPTTAGVYAPQNLARTRTRGVEATLDADGLRLGPLRLSGGGAYALTDARDRSAPGTPSYGRPLRYVARHVLKGWAGAALPVAGGALRLDLHGRLVGRRPTRADGGAPLPAHVVLDAQLRLARPLGRVGAEVGVAVENVTNARYAVVEGYPMPPRHGRLTLHLTF